MKIQYFEDTDTLYMTFHQSSPIETRELDEDTLLDLDEDGKICSMTIEHATEKIDKLKIDDKVNSTAFSTTDTCEKSISSPEENLDLNDDICNILCIGASTYNPGTPQRIREALLEFNFLKGKWAAIIAIHRYLPLYKDDYAEWKKYRYSEFQDLDVVIIDEVKEYQIMRGKIYILPDSFSGLCDWHPPYNCRPVYKINIISDNTTCTQKFVVSLFEQDENPFPNEDEKPRERKVGDYYCPDIDEIMKQVASNKKENQKIAGIILAGKGIDGTLGLLKINEAGGKTAVQSPEECHNPNPKVYFSTREMPENALNHARTQGIQHSIISLEESPTVPSLSNWLSDLKTVPHNRDIHFWLEMTIAQLRSQYFQALDLSSLIEELENLAGRNWAEIGVEVL
jgi:uncharacterized protein YuzE